MLLIRGVGRMMPALLSSPNMGLEALLSLIWTANENEFLVYVTTSVSSTGIFDPRLSISIKILKKKWRKGYNANMNIELRIVLLSQSSPSLL